MRIGIVLAMEEEFKAVSTLALQKLMNDDSYKIYMSKYKNLEVFAIIAKIGKAAAASATTHLINRHNPDFLINLGSSGGVNSAKIASIVLGNAAGYYDVDATAFGYKLGQLPQQKEFFTSQESIVKFNDLLSAVKKQHEVLNGFVITGDSFVADKTKVDSIKTMYQNTMAIEMEAAAFAQVCNTYNKDFLLVKKISDMADSGADKSFKEEIAKMSENTTSVMQAVLDYLSDLK
ncbi:MAG: 5'-methylthioadenosine/adenosylhomocysteine nucleosidase [Alphaproteobacteria bacterium]|jgi:adenosylhomocysteine nucleosidase|nr:5'-methylthioadenosine/adenosylhomocysteine nucleosidase [Alphaproteobacteria bacterium]